MFRLFVAVFALTLSSPVHAQKFDFAALTEIIRTKNVKTIEQLLPLLPAELRNDYVLMYRSRSLQGADYDSPRVLLYGTDARFILSFNGNSSQKGFNDIETVEFNERTERFEFREINFDNGFHISETNPAKCLRCHQSATRTDVDPRPNWEPYSFWPGSYGSQDGKFHHSATIRARMEKILEKDPELLAIVKAADGEKEGFAKYLKAAPEHPRYKHLGPFKINYDNGYKEPHTRAATELSRNLGLWNYRRIARLSRTTKVYAKYKYALVGTMLCFNRPNQEFTFDKFLPPNLLSVHGENTRVKDYSRDTIVADFALAIRRIFEPWGIDTSDWSMDFRTQGRLSFSSRFGIPGDSPASMYNAFVAGDPTLGATCEIHRDRSLKALSQQSPPPKMTPNSNSPDLLKRCTECHSGPDRQAPYLPFDRPDDLRPLLKSDKFDRGTLMQEILYRIDPATDSGERMPPSGDVSPADLGALIRYFENIAK